MILGKRERIRDIIDHPSIHTTLVIIIVNATVVNKMRASDVDQRIILSQIFQNWTLQIR